jgi:hypothetical protein
MRPSSRILLSALSAALSFVACGGNTTTGSSPGEASDASLDHGSDSASPSDAAAANDASSSVDAAEASVDSGGSDGSSLPSCASYCTASQCSGASQYCEWQGDNMGNGGGGCMSLPAACQAQPTCACLQSAGVVTGGCTCGESNGVLVVACC